ncbi:MAG TPA: hypothetical protein VK276_08285 [Rubrobacteraceae bacterium]|nr:hypothetical protein [Rubrobacteraceae bacterium]
MSQISGPISDGVRAAELLEEACRSAQGAPKAPRIEVVRELALDLGRQLDALSVLAREDATLDVLTEAAICCADLANLAACNAPDLPPDAAPHVTEAARLAAGTVGALAPIIEFGSGDLDARHAENLLRDVRSAGWRATFATRIAEGPGGESRSG